MAETTKPPRETISARIDPAARQAIEKAAAARRTTPSQVARVILEDGAKALVAEQQQAA